jgi:hypothetical protein
MTPEQKEQVSKVLDSYQALIIRLNALAAKWEKRCINFPNGNDNNDGKVYLKELQQAMSGKKS